MDTMMKDAQAARSEAGVGSPAAVEAADRTFLLECRLDQLHSALQSARAEADQARTRLAEAVTREADYARRAADSLAELASAREEVALLHRRLEHSEALRAETEGRLLESGARDEAGELVRLRREEREQRRRADANAKTLSEMRARIEELMATRETLLTRVAEWQRVVRHGEPEAVDLSEFIAALRGDILELEHRNVLAAEREAELREQLERAGFAAQAAAASSAAAQAAAPLSTAAEAEPQPNDVESAATVELDDNAALETSDETPLLEIVAAAPGTPPPAEDLAGALVEAGGAERQIEQLRRLGKSREESAFYAIRRWATAPEPRVRAAAFEALGRHLEEDPERLEHHLRWGLADADPRVRRRVVLAAATARGLAIRPLLEPLRLDPDPQVRRVIHEVLRRASSEAATPAPDEIPLAASAGSR
jgi:chromosome segregation ATPase